MCHLPIERLEVLRVVRKEKDIVVSAPSKQCFVGRVFTEAVFLLRHLIAAFSQDSLEHTTDVFIEEDMNRRTHETGSFGFSDDSRTRSNASAFSRSRVRISSMLS